MAIPCETVGNFSGWATSGQELRFRTRLSSIPNKQGLGLNSDSARDSRKFRQFQRVSGRTSEGARIGDPGIMILCETLNNFKGSGAVKPDRVAALSQNGYGHGRAGLISQGGRGGAVPGQGHARNSSPSFKPRQSPARDCQRAPKSWPSLCGRAKFFAEFFKARMPCLKTLGREFGATSKTLRGLLGAPNI